MLAYLLLSIVIHYCPVGGACTVLCTAPKITIGMAPKHKWRVGKLACWLLIKLSCQYMKDSRDVLLVAFPIRLWFYVVYLLSAS